MNFRFGANWLRICAGAVVFFPTGFVATIGDHPASLLLIGPAGIGLAMLGIGLVAVVGDGKAGKR
jgi:hypothetical protein